jgi:hypothetical protein
MKKNKLQKLSIVNLCIGYLMMFSFVSLVFLGRQTTVAAEEDSLIVINDEEIVIEDVPDNKLNKEEGIIETKVDPLIVVKDYSIGVDRLHRVIERDDPNLVSIINGREVIIDDSDYEISKVDRYNSRTIVGDRANHGLHRVNGGHHVRGEANIRGSIDHVDSGYLDRRLASENFIDNTNLDPNLTVSELEVLIDGDNIGLDLGGNNNINTTHLELDEGQGDDTDLGDVNDFAEDGLGAGKGNLPGVGEGSQVYAYNFPSQGVGAGIGNAGIGAAAGFAGIGAGIGEAVLNGKTVPTLGGIGTSRLMPLELKATPENDRDGDGLPASVESDLGTNPNNSDTDGDGIQDGDEISQYSNPLDKASTPSNPGSSPLFSKLAQTGGVGGLVGGAGAGGAAGLTQGIVMDNLGLGLGEGCSEHGAACDGHHGHAEYNYDHLPKDGSLHIMMHVDGSGSILNTRKQLDIMKDTLLKDALLPYYNNDESLYNKRVTIVDGNGERTLQFYTLAAKKDNVLAIAFQDEAAPDYHLPTFNKIPQNHYSDDLNKLKANLNNHRGVYRGIMFQVDRGKTFAKSFKEFVECSWQGKGYLEGDSLKKYYWEDNLSHVKNKDGIVFSDVYHTKDEGDPQYYLNVIFEATKKIGLDLNIYGAGNTDGKYIKNN